MNRILPIALLALILAGCGDGASSTDLDAKLNAAMEIGNSQERDQKLADIAIEAADAGNGDVVKKAIEEIRVVQKKNPTAKDAAIKLKKAGQGDAALEVAKMITVNPLRDETLQELAD